MRSFFLSLFSTLCLASARETLQRPFVSAHSSEISLKHSHVFHVDSREAEDGAVMALYQMDTGEFWTEENDNATLQLDFNTVPGQRSAPVPIQDENRWYAPIAERELFFAGKSLQNKDAFHLVPNEHDPRNVMAMAVVTSNAYTLPPKKDWMRIDPFGLRLVRVEL